MQHSFWLAKPYGLANQKLCYIPIYKSWRKGQIIFVRMVDEYEPRTTYKVSLIFDIHDHISQNICSKTKFEIAAFDI